MGRRLALAMGFAASALLAACGGGGGDAETAQGTLKISMTDAPACYENVFVTVEKIRVHKVAGVGEGQEGWQEIVPPGGPVRIDLLDLTNGALADLGSATIPSGTYNQLRLVLAENTAANPTANAVKPNGGGALQPLKTPSAQQSGLKLRTPIFVGPDVTTEILVDFDACNSVVSTGVSGGYLLKPVLRLADKLEGAIEGYVSTTLPPADTTVSAQINGEVVRATVPGAGGRFRLAYLPRGDYTVVITSKSYATAVVTGVPVRNSTVALNTSSAAILPPSSLTHVVSGEVTAGSGKVGDAIVAARQAISGGGRIQVLSTPVDFELGTYSMVLPQANIGVAPYASGGLVFANDATANGEYTLRVTAPDRAVLSRTIDSRAGPTSTEDFAY